MSQTSPIRPLSVGNVVSAGLRLYRSHLQDFLKLSIIAYLWVLVPVYGWAKCAAIHGLVARLVFAELINEPESISAAREKIEPLKWSFLGVAFRVWLRVFLVYLGLALVGFILGGIVGFILGFILGPLAGFLTVLVILVVVVLGITWFYSRLVVAEVPLAVEENVNGRESVDRSWSLTETSVFRIQGIVLVAFLVTVPLLAVFNYVPNFLLIPLEQGSAIYIVVYVLSIISSLVGSALIMPFWQAIKAVLYYDLRSRREGLGLQLRDRDSSV
ncbi:MAG: hypothetical protein KME16_11060 [Scytolyngbya sp. HA4215-MV1]|nr:hypothetical protein [Scytolyngbya sp. HA4215-MV1]